MPKRAAVAKVLLICGVVVFIIIVVVIAFYYSLGNYAKNEGTEPNGLRFFPNDTHLFLRPTLCERLTLNVSRNSYPYSASIAVLKSAPSLSKQPSFSLVTQPTNSSGVYVDYPFHFYPESEVRVSACRLGDSSSQATFYFVNDKDFKALVKSKSSKVKTKFEITDDCQQQINHTYSSNRKRDIYHLVFYSSSNSLSGINASLTITQFQYSPRQSDILSNCSITGGGEPCTVNVPVSASSTLLSYTLKNTTNWVFHENVLMFSCSPRSWLIFVISLGATVTMITLILLTVAILFAVIACRKKHDPVKEPALIGDTTPLVQ